MIARLQRLAGVALFVIAVQVVVTGAFAQTPLGDASPSATPTASGSPVTPIPGASPTPEPEPETDDSPIGPGLALTSSVLDRATVGAPIAYRIVLKSVGDESLKDILVTDFVPTEVSIAAVGHDPDRVAHTQVDRSVVWVVNSVPPGERVTLRWTGTVVRAGDLVARNRVEVKARNLPLVTSETATTLSIPPGWSSTVGSPEAPNSVAGPGGGLTQASALPSTGRDSTTTNLMLAVALMALGSLLLWGAGPQVASAGGPIAAFDWAKAAPSLSETSSMPWVTVCPEGMRLWRMVEELRRAASFPGGAST